MSNKRELARLQSQNRYILAQNALRKAKVDFIPYPDRRQINVVTRTKHNGKYKVWNYWSASDKFYCSNTGEKGIGINTLLKKIEDENFAVAGVPIIVSAKPPKVTGAAGGNGGPGGSVKAVTLKPKVRSVKGQKGLCKVGVGRETTVGEPSTAIRRTYKPNLLGRIVQKIKSWF